LASAARFYSQLQCSSAALKRTHERYPPTVHSDS
jgi:hypothetical protein